MENLETKKYEIMLILPPDLGEEKTKKELDEVRSIILENGGEIFNEDLWGVRNFAYKIKKQDQGYYAVFNFSIEPAKLKKLDKPLVLNQNVVRYLIVKTPDNYEMITLEVYEERAAKEELEKEKKKKEKEEGKFRPKPKVAKKEEPKKEEPEEEPKKEEPKKEEPKKEEPEEEPKKEEPKKEEPEEEPKQEEPKEEKKPVAKLDDVDERLKSIIDDPDISL
ncbi:MAG: 30S ribosomal protein S6 [Nitrospirota bacterium]